MYVVVYLRCLISIRIKYSRHLFLFQPHHHLALNKFEYVRAVLYFFFTFENILKYEKKSIDFYIN